MIVSRWKVMAGVIGVSVGGLAAIAGQCPRPGETNRRAEETLFAAAEAPKVPPAGGAPARPTPPPAVELPPPPITADVPAVPAIPAAAPVKPPELPASPATKPEALPALPDIKPADAKKPEPQKYPDIHALPPKGVTTGLTPAGSFAPDLDVRPATATPPTPPVNGLEFTKPTAPPASADPLVGKPTAAPQLVPPSDPPAPAITSTIPDPAPAKIAAAAPAAVQAAAKFRIVLRVGEGEPTFEVRHDDHLVMKVTSEKVDIKSPEKGQGLSAVTASGKVRFVGFGAEGTCDTLSFLAGTGEVSMAGNVNVKVRDKIGRVESELTTDKMQYKLDNTALTGVLKP